MGRDIIKSIANKPSFLVAIKVHMEVIVFVSFTGRDSRNPSVCKALTLRYDGIGMESYSLIWIKYVEENNGKSTTAKRRTIRISAYLYGRKYKSF